MLFTAAMTKHSVVDVELWKMQLAMDMVRSGSCLQP